MKRFMDVLVSCVALAVLWPVLLLVALVIRVAMGSPVFFVQARPGLGGRPFNLVKFRTMRNARSSDGSPLPDSQRLGRLGRVLRSTSLDELPELINVLRGEMSLVGPRPLLIEYLPLYSPQQARRHEVLPGITGWAQVNGRNAISWEEKFAFDIWYVDNRNIWLDCRILLLTVVRVFTRHGISAKGEATASAFGGSPAEDMQ